MPAWTINISDITAPIDVGPDTVNLEVDVRLYFTREDIAEIPLAGQLADPEAVGAMIADTERYGEWANFIMEVLALVIQHRGYPEARIGLIPMLSTEDGTPIAPLHERDTYHEESGEDPTHFEYPLPAFEVRPVPGGMLLDFPVGPEPTKDPDLD